MTGRGISVTARSRTTEYSSSAANEFTWKKEGGDILNFRPRRFSWTYYKSIGKGSSNLSQVKGHQNS